MDAYQQQQQQSAFDYGQGDYEKRRDSRPQSRPSSRPGSRSNSRPPSRPMSRASSQQRFYEDTAAEYAQPQQQEQPRSLSRNDSQRSLTDYTNAQRQPDPIITTRIEESYVEPGMESIRKPSVTFKNDEYEQQSQNLQQVAEQRSPIYAPQPPYEDQSYYQPQPSEYDYGQPQQNMGYAYEQPQYVPPQQYEQPVTEPRYYQPESRRQSPENSYQQVQGYSGSRRQSPEQSYIEPQTPKRASPPKTPTREQSREELDKIVQQRQQSREQLYGRDEGEESAAPSKALSSKQQSRDNLSEQPEKPPSPPTKAPGSAAVKQVAPPSPKRASAVPRNSTKGGAEQKAGRNAVGEAAGPGRKSDNMQKQPAKGLTNIRGKK